MKRLGICPNCRLKQKVTRKGLIKRHWHPYVEGLYRCRGGKQAPLSLVPVEPRTRSGFGAWL